MPQGTLATAATLGTVGRYSVVSYRHLKLTFYIGAGLLWYGQNYLIYPSAFPPGSRIGLVRFLPEKDMRLMKVTHLQLIRGCQAG